MRGRGESIERTGAGEAYPVLVMPMVYRRLTSHRFIGLPRVSLVTHFAMLCKMARCC
jgi:hypothetical protein